MDSRHGQPPHYKIYVRMTKTVPLDVMSTDTIDQIKSKIGALEGIDSSQQALFFAGNQLENDNGLADYNILANSCVDLYVTDGMQISVSIPSVGKTVKLNVTKSQSVADVKAVIEQKAGIPLNKQILMYGCEKLEDNKSLSQCGLSNGHTLRVLVRPHISDQVNFFVKTYEGRTLTMSMKTWDTVEEVMKVIGGKLNVKTDVYYLHYRGRVLYPGETLWNHNINNDSTVDVRLRNSHVVEP